MILFLRQSHARNGVLLPNIEGKGYHLGWIQYSSISASRVEVSDWDWALSFSKCSPNQSWKGLARWSPRSSDNSQNFWNTHIGGCSLISGVYSWQSGDFIQDMKGCLYSRSSKSSEGFNSRSLSTRSLGSIKPFLQIGSFEASPFSWPDVCKRGALGLGPRSIVATEDL